MVLDSTSSGPPSSRGPRPAPASGADGMTLRFTDAMWAEIRPIYDAILGLPFNRELAAGTLSRERFAFYMVQDAHYLGAFARALATAAAKATSPETQTARQERARRHRGRALAARGLFPRLRDHGRRLRRYPALAD